MPEQEWVDAGLLDPAAPDADELRELLAWLDAQGLALEELVEAAATDNLHSAAADRRLRPPATMTREELAERLGVTPEQVDRVWLASGFPPPPPGVKVFGEDDLLLAVFPSAASLFDEDTLLAFARVMGAAMARIAEAADAMFVTDVEEPRRIGGARAVELAQIVDEGVRLLLNVPDLLRPLFRRHALAAIERSRVARAADRGGQFSGAFRTRLVVGFADLVGYTALAERMDPRRLAAAVARFERAAFEGAVAAGAQVVKAIGDAVMLVGPDAVTLVDVVTGLADQVAADDELTSMRGAVVAGEVLARGGDYFGPTVNLAARATKEAAPGGVVVNDAVAAVLAEAGRRTTRLQPRHLRGFDDPVVLHEVGRG